MALIDLVIPLAFIAYALTAGFVSREKASRGLEEYFLAGRNVRGWQAGMSMTATQFAADTPLIVTGLVATAGLFSLWQLWSYGLAFLLLGFLFAPSWRRAGVLTDAELCTLRYSGAGARWLRILRASLFGLVFNCVVVAMVLLASSYFAAELIDFVRAGFANHDPITLSAAGAAGASGTGPSPLAVWLCVVGIAGIALVYSASGGLRSVVGTDVVQLCLMGLGMAAYAGFALHAVGGLEALRGQLAAAGASVGLSERELLALSPRDAREAGAGVLAVFGLQWLLQRNADGTGYLAQRAMACRTDRDARVAASLFAFLQIGLRSLLWVVIALALLVLIPPQEGLAGVDLVRDRETSFVRGMTALLPPGVLGLMWTAMLAALMSTLDTHLNWGASYVANDLHGALLNRWRGRSPSPREQVWVARLANLALLGLALAITAWLDTIQEAWRATLVLGAGIGAVTVLRWLWWRVTAWAELAALLVSFVGTPLAVWAFDENAARMLALAAASTLVTVVVALAGPATDPAVLEQFARRVRPPGFWGPYDQGHARRDLARALLATAAAAVTLYAGLIATLRALFPLPDTSPLTVPLLSVLALAALPLWWRDLR